MIGNLAKIVMRTLYQALKTQDVWLGQLACYTMKWRGFSTAAIHPKHLFDPQRAGVLQEVLKPGMNVLDLGSGVGSDCISAKKNGAGWVVGVERDPANIETAVSRARQAGVEVTFIAYDLEQAALPVVDAAFDLINFSDVLEHLNNRMAILKDLKRKKRPGGRVVISIPNADTSWKNRLRAVGLDSRDDTDHKIEYSERAIREEMACAGLSILSDLRPIIPSFPFNGLIAMTAAVSPGLYRRLQTAKRRFVERKPEESIGWEFIAE